MLYFFFWSGIPGGYSVHTSSTLVFFLSFPFFRGFVVVCRRRRNHDVLRHGTGPDAFTCPLALFSPGAPLGKQLDDRRDLGGGLPEGVSGRLHPAQALHEHAEVRMGDGSDSNVTIFL